MTVAFAITLGAKVVVVSEAVNGVTLNRSTGANVFVDRPAVAGVTVTFAVAMTVGANVVSVSD